MFEPDADGVLFRLRASSGRRAFGVGALYILGAVLVWLALSRQTAGLWAVPMVGLGAAALWAGERLRRATAAEIVLTADGLRDSDGRVLARMDRIASVERGSFAMKPSNGFLLILTEPAPRAWVPGLWWRAGRHVGVGGVTPMREARFMAERLALMLAARDDADRS